MPLMDLPVFSYRYQAETGDLAAIRQIVDSTGFFNPAEVDIAVELVEERLAKGPASGYHFVFAEQAARVAGYACYGPIAGTQQSYDLFWIAVHRDFQNRGLGRDLLGKTEACIAQAGGGRVYVETSSREQYVPTRRFYERQGYCREAELVDFYAHGDHKVIYVRVVPAS